MTSRGGDRDPRRQGGQQVKERPETRTKKPRPWKVLLHNDDYTTMDFVVAILVRHFDKSLAEAQHVMLQVHHSGIGVAGIYPRDIAETKVDAVTREAREEGMPLKVTAEPE